MSNTCKTCKWWRDPSKVTVWIQGKEVSRVEGYCSNDKLGYEGNDHAWSLGDWNDATGLIHTGPDFGCIHHEVSSVPPSA